MENQYLAFAIPAFFIFLSLEIYVAKIKKKEGLFNLNDSLSNLTIGIAERLLDLFIAASFYQLFYWIYENYALLNIPNTWWVWVITLLATDLVWYWYHRLGHEINILWAAHIVHHQSEYFNFTVAARITVFQAIIRNLFWCILPFIGFPPSLVITILLIHGAYSFFTHTQVIGSLGWLEKVFISPSLHGVHHASNEVYLNKNFGDLFVFWDKIFGTFMPESEKPKYGLTHPLKSYSFLWQHFHYYIEIITLCFLTKGFKNKIKIIFGNPDNMDQSLRPKLEKYFIPNKKDFDKKTNKSLTCYIIVQIVITASLLFYVTYNFHDLQIAFKLFTLIWIILTLINCNALLEQRNWLFNLEKFRAFVLLAFITFDIGSIELFILSFIFIISLDIISPAKEVYYSIFYQEE